MFDMVLTVLFVLCFGTNVTSHDHSLIPLFLHTSCQHTTNVIIIITIIIITRITIIVTSIVRIVLIVFNLAFIRAFAFCLKRSGSLALDLNLSPV